MKLAILLASRNHPERVAALLALLRDSVQVPHDLFVVEAGTSPQQISPEATLWYLDSQFRGKAFGHCLALQHARMSSTYDYVWILGSDLAFEPGIDPAAALIALMEREPRMAIAAPTLRSGNSPADVVAAWKPIATCESLGFVMRMSAVEEVGFLNPQFQYGWGAMDELAHRLYRAHWFIARAQGVGCHYLPTSTQGHDLSFDEYWRRARRFAFDYFRERHGEHWDELFWSATAGHAIEINAFREHKRLWSGAFTAQELLERSGGDVAPSIAATPSRPDAARPVRVEAPAPEAWPLATEAPYRVLAWPDYADERELERFFDTYARPLVGRSDACLCLRYDEQVDGPEEPLVERLQRVYGRTLGAEAPLEVLLVDDALEPADLPRLGAAVIGFAVLPSGELEPRRAFLAATGAPALCDDTALRARLDRSSHARYGREVLDGVDFGLVRRIQDLHPWAEPAVLGNLAVRAGHGTCRSAQTIQKRVERRRRAIVTPLLEQNDLRGARILELNCGIGLFSATLVAAGASRVVLVETRTREAEQAELYWDTNGFLPRGDWRLVRTPLGDVAAWDELARSGPFDVVLWTHALDGGIDLASRARVLARAATRSLVIDLSRSDDAACKDDSEQPLVQALRELGLEIEVTSWTPPGQSSGESIQRRVVLARKTKVIHVPASALPQRASAPQAGVVKPQSA